MSHKLDDQALDIIFRKARTHIFWQDKPVSDDVLRQVYDLMKWGPTSANCSPARILFLCTPEAKERLRAALSPTNVDKTMQAPVTAIIAHDLKFYENLPRLFPNNPAAREWFSGNPQLAEVTAFRNGLYRADISFLPRALSAWTAARCPASTTPRWTRNSFPGRR